MDTKFWGPDGWLLLHQIAYTYPLTPTQIDKDNYKIFFESLKYVLPCIWCRKSYIIFVEELPITDYLHSRAALSEWLYLIHNKVNDKLRNQGFLKTPNPAITEIHNKYKGDMSIRGWDFIYCILLNYPENDISAKMKLQYTIFFKYLCYVLPNLQIRQLYCTYYNTNSISNGLHDRKALITWFYNIYKYICNIHNISVSNYQDTCAKYEYYRAGCNNGTCKR